MTIIADIPRRAEYLIAEKNFSEAEKKEVAESFLNHFIQGALANSESESEIQSIKKKVSSMARSIVFLRLIL